MKSSIVEPISIVTTIDVTPMAINTNNTTKATRIRNFRQAWLQLTSRKRFHQSELTNVISERKRKSLSSETDFPKGVFFKVPSISAIASSDVSATSSSPSNSCSSSSRTVSSVASSSSSSSTSTSPTSWKSTERKSFLLHQPLIVSDPENVDLETEIDPASALGKVMARSRQLPGTDYYSSNHILVNQERVRRVIAPLSRLSELDSIAREHAEAMANKEKLFHSNPADISTKFQRPFRRMGENVARGKTIRDIHNQMMKNSEEITTDKYNILHRCYTHMGMGTAKGADGQLYLCQVFRG